MIIRNISIIKGDKYSFRLVFKNSDTHQSIDITGWIITLTVKKTILDEDSKAVIKKVVTNHDDPTHGKTLIELTGTETDIRATKYVYDIRVKDLEGPISLMQGDFNVNLPITREI